MTLKKPTLLLDEAKCRANIRRMKAKADKYHLHFRPHFKTHQSAAVAGWFSEAGVNSITVSSVTMAGYFACAGWNDITIAFPVNIHEADDINRLAGLIRLNLVVENTEVIGRLATQLKFQTGVYLKTDAGYHRTGIPVHAHKQALKLIEEIGKYPLFNFKGLLAHNGHTYHASSVEDIREIHRQSLDKLLELKTFLQNHGIKAELSIGDTPSMSVTGYFDGVDEIRPGNFVFYDVMQESLGSCAEDEIAVALACPVVAKHHGRQEIVIYGGAVHLSKDFITDDEGNRVYGKIVTLKKEGWSQSVPGAYLKSLSQEHGIITAGRDFFDKTAVGDFIGVLPVHSCLAVNLMREYLTLKGERIGTMGAE